MADMQIDKYGNDVGYKNRLFDISTRYTKNSIQYLNSSKVIEECIKEFEKLKPKNQAD